MFNANAWQCPEDALKVHVNFNASCFHFEFRDFYFFSKMHRDWLFDSFLDKKSLERRSWASVLVKPTTVLRPRWKKSWKKTAVATSRSETDIISKKQAFCGKISFSRKKTTSGWIFQVIFWLFCCSWACGVPVDSFWDQTIRGRKNFVLSFKFSLSRDCFWLIFPTFALLSSFYPLAAGNELTSFFWHNLGDKIKLFLLSLILVMAAIWNDTQSEN